jgi:excisionase family DNA binding protein
VGLLTVRQAAAALGVTVPAVRGALRRKALVATRLPERPHRTFIPRDEVERYQQEHLRKRRRQARADSVAQPELY